MEHFIVHARKAVLGGLSPDANRKIPPLKPAMVARLAGDFPSLRFTLNGGVETLEECQQHLAGGALHGVMLGRAVVARPWHLMAGVDRALYGDQAARPGGPLTRRRVLGEYGAYADRELAAWYLNLHLFPIYSIIFQRLNF